MADWPTACYPGRLHRHSSEVILRDRSRRLQAERRILRRRIRRAKLTLLGASPKAERQPHRLLKHKAKFTSQRGSMKEDKRLANRAARARARDALKRGEDPPSESRNSVRWDYW